MFTDALQSFDPEVFAACDREMQRQQHNIELIASENIVSKAVLLAAGSVLTNKYAEGYPGKRYYGGCVYVDEVDVLVVGGGAAGRTREKAFRRRACQCSAAQRRKRQSRRLFRPAAAGRYRARHEPCPRRSPVARLARQHFREIFSCCFLWGGRRDGSHRL